MDIITLVSNKIFVGSLPFEFTDEQLRALFVSIGSVASAKMVEDKKNGRTRGFGFVAMSHDNDIQTAIEKLNGTVVGEKKIWVTEARPKDKPAERPALSSQGRPEFRGPRRFQRDFRRPQEGRQGESHFFDPLMNRRPPRPEGRRPSGGPRTGERGSRTGFGSPPRGGDRPRRSGFSAPRGRGRPGGFGGVRRRQKP